MKIRYARVNTQDQRLELQLGALPSTAVSRSTRRRSPARARPELEKMIAQLRPGDTVVVWKLDRLGRSLKDLIELVEGFKERGWSL